MSIDVNAGETYNDAWLFNEDMNVFSDGIANNTLVDKNSILTVYKGGTINTTIINGDGEVDLLSSGSANATQIMTDGILNVGEKAVASGTVVEGGSLVVEEKGIASDTTVNGPGQMYVSSAGKIKGTTTVNDGGFLTLEWESIHSSAIIHGGKLTVLGGPAEGDMAFLQNFTVDSGGSMTVSGSALVSSGTIADGWAKVTSNGILEKVTLNAATVEIKNGALLSNADMKTGTVVDIASGGVIRKLAVSKGAVLTGVLRDVSELHFDGGTLDLNISGIAPGGEFLIGDTAYSAYISGSSYECTLTVNASGQTNGTYSLIEGATSSFDKTVTVKDFLGSTLGTLTVGGSLTYGMSKYTLGIDSTGLFVTVGLGNVITGDVTGETKDVPDGWTALGVNVNVDGILNVLNGGVASDTTINYHGNVNVSNGGVASNTTVNSGGDLYLYEGGSASGVTINDGGWLQFLGEITNASVEDVKVSSGGKLFTIAGTSVKDIDAEAGANLALTVAKKTYAAGKYAGTPFEIKEVVNDFTPFGGLGINNGGIAINTKVNKDIYVYVDEGGLASMTTLYTDARMYVGSGGSAHIAYVSGGSLTIRDKGSAGLVNVGDLGQVYVSSGGVASNVVVYQYGAVTVSKGGVAGNVTVNKDGTAIVSGTVSGAYISDGGQLNIEGTITGQMTFETGAFVNAEPGAILDFDLTQTAPGAAALVNNLSFAMATDFSYTLTVDGTEVNGDYKLAENAIGFDKTITVVNTSGTTLGTLTVADGKTTIDGRDYTLTLSTGGLLGLTLAGGKTVDLTGDLYTTYNLETGMYGRSVNIQAGGDLHIKNGASADQLTVNSGGDLRISAGASADDVTANFGADAYIYAGATVTKLKENGGSVIVYDGATVEFVPTSFTGYFYNTIDQWATIHSGTTGTKLTAANEGGIDVYSGGIAIDTTIGSLGNLYVLDGGKVTGKTKFDTGASILADPGAILDFDLTATTPGADALVNGLSLALTQAFTYTLTVSGTDSEGDYKLAEGATGFDKTITVVNTSGTTLGTLTVAGGKTTIDGRDYTLTLNSGILGLTLADGGITPDLTGDLTTEYHLTAGMVGSDVNILNGGELDVENGALASKTTVNSGGSMCVSAGGSADVTTVNYYGKLHVSKGALASQTTITSGGKLYVSEGGVATGVTANSGGSGFIYIGGTATGIVADEGAYFYIELDSTTYAQGTCGGAPFEFTAHLADCTIPSIFNIEVLDGGTVDNVTVECRLSVCDGAKATGVSVVSGGRFCVESGGTATGIVAAEGAKLNFDVAPNTYAQGTYAGSAFEITDTVTGYAIHSGGVLGVYAGGKADAVTVNYGGYLYITVGGAATQITENGGGVYIEDGVTVTFVAHEFTGVNVSGLNVSATVHSGTTATDTAVSDYGQLHVFSGGIAKNTTVNTEGGLYVLDGGVATNTTVDYADVYVWSGGVASDTKLVNVGWLSISSGGVASNTTVNTEGGLFVSNGGVANKTTVNTGGALVVSTGGKADGMNLKGGTLFVSDGGRITGKMTFETGATVNADTGAILDFDLTQTAPGADALVNDLSFIMGDPNFTYTLTVSGTDAAGDYKLAENATGFDKTITVVNTSGSTLGTLTVGATTTIDGRDYTLTLNSGILGLTLAGGGITPDITGDLTTTFELTAGMVGSSVNILNGGDLEVLTGGFTSKTTVNSNGDLNVSGGGSADIVTVNFGGDLFVRNGGIATLVMENGGYVVVNDGATVTFVPNSFTGYVYDNNNDWATLHSGTTGTDLSAANKGRIYVYSGGIASDITVNDKGIVEGNSGGLIDGVVVNSGGSLLIYNGAKLTGQMTFVTGAEVIPFVGSILDFDLTQTAPDAAALVNDLSILMGTPGYTLTVAGTEASGTYNLAGGVTSFDKTITVMSPLGEEYGTLTVGGSLSTAFADYTLNLSSGVLTLDLVAKVVVDTTPPVVSNVAADITAPTNGNVTVTADFTDNVAVAQKLFKFNDEPWQAYPTGGVLVTENATVSFMAIDTSSNNSDVVVITIGNIDKVPPTITAITPSTTEPATSVTVTASFSDDVGVAYQQFKIGDGAWQDYTTGVTVTENATVYFRAADAAGNVTNASYDVTNIQTLEPDTTKPTVINVAADVTAQTNGNVTVTADFTDNVAVQYKYYKLAMESLWLDYPDAGVTVTENGTVYFEAVDTSGNVSEVVTFSVTNIDKVAPTITGITPSTTAPAASVTVTATFSDNVALAAQQYKIGGGAWQNYVDGVLVTENALVTFKAVDTAGNETTATYNVTNISSGGGTVVTGDIAAETKDINTGMVASDVNVNANGILNVYAGGLASKTTVNAEGGLFVSNGGVASQTTVNAGGELFVSAGGSADSNTVIGGTLYVYDGGVATDTTLQDNGSIIINNGGSAGNTTAEADGWIRVSAGGVAEDVTVKNGGKLLINDGGKVTGKMTFETGALVSAYDGAILDFNIYSLSPANEALVNDLSILQGTPKYTLTINGAQMLGTYNLAGGATGFDQTITVQSILGAEVGTLTVGGGETKIGDVFYTLNLTGSDLTVTVSSGGEADTTKPVVTNVMASITTPTNGDVTVTASFYDNVAVASSLYKINSGDWQNYTGGVTLTENATVYFKAIDTSGNESDVVSITVNNIDKTAPEKPTASANVTAPTNGSVNVTAIFAEDSVQNEYSMDGVNWAPYPGLVKFDNNGTVYFRSTDEVGNISEIESYAVTNIDKVPPAKPTASADITTTTSGNVTVTAVFSGDSEKKEFSLDGLVWQNYTAPLVFSANGKAYFRATDAAGNQSDIISYSVTNIQPATPDNAPDDSKNDWVYNKKTKEWNSEANLASFVVNNITAGDSEVRLDKVGSVEKDGKHNFVGRSGSDEDAADYAKIELSKGAALTFSVDSTIAGTFVVLQATTDKKGNPVTTQRQKISVKAGQTSPKKTTTIYLEAGEYFVGMEAKLPSAKKGDAAAYYNVNLAGTTFFDDADNGWNNTAYKLDGDGKEVKTELNPELVSGAMLFGRGATAIQLDTGTMGKDGYANWVGFSDATDYRMLTLENAANVTLSLTATGKAKLTVWQVSTNAKTGVISLKSKGSVSVKAGATGLVKSKFLEAGTYFVSVESTDAKKGGSAYYNVSVDSTSVFFDSADTGKNDELYDKKAKSFYPEDDKHHFVTTNVSGAGTSVQLDSDPVKADGYKNFVGYQDKTDYAKVNLTTDGNLFFKLKATGDATFTVYRKGQDKKGNDTLETIQTTKLKLAKGASVIDKFTDVISGLTAGEYYISMAATNTSNSAKGSVFYNVTATLEPSVAASLAMPETDSLASTDALSLGRFNADALADISSASPLAELDDKSAWQNLALA